MITLALIGVLVFLMALRIPISICIGVAALISLLLADLPLDLMPRLMTDSLDEFALLAVPFFVLAGNLMNASGVTQRIFNFARALFGWLRGGLAHVNVGASMIFAGMSGSALADLAGLGALEIRAMRENDYPVDFSAAVSIASCTIGPMIPPSIMLVIYGLATDTSVGRLFLGGVIPGVVIGAILMVWISLMVRWKNVPWGQPEAFSGRQLWKTFKAGFLALMAPFVIIGTLIGGLTTPSELGAIAAGYAFLVGLIYGELTWKRLHRCLIDSIINTGVVMFLIAVSQVFGWVMTSEGMAQDAAQLMIEYIANPLVGLLIINLFLIIIGMFLEGAPALLILAPILLPVVQAFGIDPVHFGIILCFNLLIGIITPPMGIGLFVAGQVAGISPERVLKACVPFLVPLVIGLGILTAFPQMVLWLPNLVMGVQNY